MLGDWNLYDADLDTLLGELSRHRPTRAELMVTLNVDHVVKLSTDQEFRDAYETARWRTVDGMPVKWLLGLVGARKTRRITGAELLPALCASDEFRGRRVLLLGGRDDDLQRAAVTLQDSCPDVTIMAVPVPIIGSPADTPDSVLDALQLARPDIVFVCLGAPKQELWVHHWQEVLPPAVYIGAGAAVAFVAGSERRAPRWVQHLGMEWLFRLAQEPTRLLRRYTTEAIPIIPIAMRSILPGRFFHRRPAAAALPAAKHRADPEDAPPFEVRREGSDRSVLNSS